MGEIQEYLFEHNQDDRKEEQKSKYEKVFFSNMQLTIESHKLWQIYGTEK